MDQLDAVMLKPGDKVKIKVIGKDVPEGSPEIDWDEGYVESVSLPINHYELEKLITPEVLKDKVVSVVANDPKLVLPPAAVIGELTVSIKIILMPWEIEKWKT